MLASLARALLVLALLGAGGAAPAGAEEVPQSSREITLSFAPVVKRAAPAVINIYTEKEVAASAADPLLADPFFRFFFKDFGRQQMPKRQQNSLGSGVIIAADGLVVTNHHVIDDADAVMVVLNDRREFPAEVVGADAAADLALLRIEAPPGLPVLPMGDSDELEVGDLVLAIGNPFGIGQSVTSGIVSALARSSPKVNDDLSFIQTDAAVNPGNSGGALVTVDGRLVGVNTAIFTRGGGGSIGIGFAIPINLVQALIRSVESGAERLARPWLGARIQTVTVKLAAGLGLDRPTGVVLNQLYADGPAARAGLEQGCVRRDASKRRSAGYRNSFFHPRIAPKTEAGSSAVAPWARAAAITAGSADRRNGFVARSSAIVDGVDGEGRAAARRGIAALSGSTAAAKRRFAAVYSWPK
jgi:serine protease Do